MRVLLSMVLLTLPTGLVAQTPTNLMALRGEAHSVSRPANLSPVGGLSAGDLAFSEGLMVADANTRAPLGVTAGAFTSADLARAEGLISTAPMVRTQDERIALLQR